MCVHPDRLVSMQGVGHILYVCFIRQVGFVLFLQINLQVFTLKKVEKLNTLLAIIENSWHLQ